MGYRERRHLENGRPLREKKKGGSVQVVIRRNPFPRDQRNTAARPCPHARLPLPSVSTPIPCSGLHCPRNGHPRRAFHRGGRLTAPPPGRTNQLPHRRSGPSALYKGGVLKGRKGGGAVGRCPTSERRRQRKGRLRSRRGRRVPVRRVINK